MAAYTRGQRVALEKAFELVARRLFEEDRDIVLALLEELSAEEVLDALPRVRMTEMEPRWRETMAPLIAGAMGVGGRRRDGSTG